MTPGAAAALLMTDHSLTRAAVKMMEPQFSSRTIRTGTLTTFAQTLRDEQGAVRRVSSYLWYGQTPEAPAVLRGSRDLLKAAPGF